MTQKDEDVLKQIRKLQRDLEILHIVQRAALHFLASLPVMIVCTWLIHITGWSHPTQIAACILVGVAAFREIYDVVKEKQVPGKVFIDLLSWAAGAAWWGYGIMKTTGW